jgi:alpha-mannosidase
MDNAIASRQGMAFNRPLITAAGQLKPSALTFRIECGPNVLCTALRQAERSDGYILRFFETSGCEGQVCIETEGAIAKAESVNFIENTLEDGLTIKGKSIKAAMHGFEVKTIRIELA